MLDVDHVHQSAPNPPLRVTLRSTDERKPPELEDLVHACWIDHKYSGRSSKRSPARRQTEPGCATRHEVGTTSSEIDAARWFVRVWGQSAYSWRWPPT